VTGCTALLTPLCQITSISSLFISKSISREIVMQEMCLPAELSAIGDTPTKFCAPTFPALDEVMTLSVFLSLTSLLPAVR